MKDDWRCSRSRFRGVPNRFLGGYPGDLVGTFVWALVKKKRRLAFGSGGISLFVGAAFLAVCAVGLLSIWITFDLDSIRLHAPTLREVQGTYLLAPDSIEWLKKQKGYDVVPDPRCYSMARKSNVFPFQTALSTAPDKGTESFGQERVHGHFGQTSGDGCTGSEQS